MWTDFGPKCDRTAGGCLNCAKFRYECPGYPEESNFIFRNENEIAQTKVEKRVAAKRRKPLHATAHANNTSSINNTHHEDREVSDQSISDDDWSIEQVFPDHYPETVMPFQNIALDMDSYAMSYFLKYFTAAGGVDPRPDLGALSDSSLGATRDALEFSMKAVALASMSTFTKAPHLAVEARRRYLKAVHKTNIALKSPEMAKSDMLLSTIMILNSFESIGGPDRQSLTDWSNHAYGTCALVKLRGKESLYTPQGIVLFTSAISLILAATIREDWPFPDELLELSEQAVEHVGAFQPFYAYFILKIRFVHFYTHHVIRWPYLKDTIDPNIALSKAIELDAAFAVCFEQVEKLHDHYVIYSPELEPYSWDGHAHVYRFFIVATLWNDMRSFRIIAHGIIRQILNRYDADLLSLTPEERAHQLQESERIQTHEQAEILATVPQHLGLVSWEGGLEIKKGSYADRNPVFNFPWRSFENLYLDPVSSGKNKIPTVPIIKAYGGYSLPWVLFTASKITHSSPEVITKVIKLLDLVGLPLGNHQATVMARIAEVEGTVF